MQQIFIDGLMLSVPSLLVWAGRSAYKLNLKIVVIDRDIRQFRGDLSELAELVQISVNAEKQKKVNDD